MLYNNQTRETSLEKYQTTEAGKTKTGTRSQLNTFEKNGKTTNDHMIRFSYPLT